MAYLYTLLICCFLLGCSSNNKRQKEIATETEIPVINLSDNVSKVSSLPLSEAADKVEIISLETADKSIFSQYEKIAVTTSDIWIHTLKEQCIYRFSRSGMFLNKVGKIGQGPGEYQGLWSFQIDNDKKEIYLLSTSSGVQVYDFEGNFKRRATSVRMDQMFTANEQQFNYYKGQFFLTQNLCTMPNLNNPTDSLWSVALTDTDFNVRKLFKNPAHVGREELLAENGGEYMGWKNYWRERATITDAYNEEFTLKFPDTDSIYRYDIATESFQLQYAIYTNEAKGDYEETHQRYQTRATLSHFTLTDYYPTKDFIYLQGFKGENIYTFAYDKSTGKVRVAEQQCKIEERKHPFINKVTARYVSDFPSAFINDFCGGTFEIKERSSGKYWLDIFEGESEKTETTIEELKSSTGNERQKQELLKKLEGMNSDSNPVLIIATLK